MAIRLSFYGTVAVAVLLLGAILMRSPAKLVVELDSPPLPGQTGDDPFYYFDNGDANDLLQGDQFFGSMNKLGVSLIVDTAIPNRSSDFVYIGNQNSDREQWILNEGESIIAGDTWDVEVYTHGVVNGETRLGVIAMLGHDTSVNGGVGLECQHGIGEIWRIETSGNPTLLERTFQPQRGVFTTIESPTDPGVSWTVGVGDGTPGDPLDNVNMGP